MENIWIFITVSASSLFVIMTFVMIFVLNKKINLLARATKQHAELLVAIKNVLKNKIAVNETTDKAEIIYQDLLQDLIPVMAAIDVMPRSTSEHPLWRALGGIMDEYDKNPFVLEKLRRSIKLDTNISRSISHYLNRANQFLQHMANTDKDGILSTTFTDGLLGQSLTFFAQAQALANSDK